MNVFTVPPGLTKIELRSHQTTAEETSLMFVLRTEPYRQGGLLTATREPGVRHLHWSNWHRVVLCNDESFDRFISP